MAAPEYVPTTQDERPRQPLGTPGHGGWTATRPGDLTTFQPSGRLFGNQGPDQGYGLVLAERFHDRLLLTEGEDEHDVMAGAMGVGLARASLFGRAPVIHDLELAYGLFGFLDPPPAPSGLCCRIRSISRRSSSVTSRRPWKRSARTRP